MDLTPPHVPRQRGTMRAWGFPKNAVVRYTLCRVGSRSSGFKGEPMFRSSHALLLLLLALMTACTTPAAPSDDDDTTVGDDDDDDDSSDDDDSEPSTPEQVLTPDGADVGVPGAFVGMRAQAVIDGELKVSNPIEVTLLDPAARSLEESTGEAADPEHEPVFELMRDALKDIEGASR